MTDRGHLLAVIIFPGCQVDQLTIASPPAPRREPGTGGGRAARIEAANGCKKPAAGVGRGMGRVEGVGRRAGGPPVGEV